MIIVNRSLAGEGGVFFCVCVCVCFCPPWGGGGVRGE